MLFKVTKGKRLKMKDVLFLVSIVFSVQLSQAQTPAAGAVTVAPTSKKVSVPTPAPVVKITIEEEANRILLAKELMNVLDMNKAVSQSLEGADNYFKQTVPEKEKDEVSKKALDLAQSKFDSVKLKMPQEINDQLVKELTQRYSSVELKYLIEITKYPLYKKFRAFLESEEYYGLIDKPYIQAKKTFTEAKRKIASEPPPKPPSRKK